MWTTGGAWKPWRASSCEWRSAARAAFWCSRVTSLDGRKPVCRCSTQSTGSSRTLSDRQADGQTDILRQPWWPRRDRRGQRELLSGHLGPVNLDAQIRGLGRRLSLAGLGISCRLFSFFPLSGALSGFASPPLG
jgi:hypothetical protein